MNTNPYNSGWVNTGYTNVNNVGYQQFPVQQKGITTVAVISGEENVASYPVAAGNTAVLMDFTNMKFWLKTTDVYGRPLPVEGYQFSSLSNIQNQVAPIPQQAQQIQTIPEQNQNDYVKKEDFNLVAQMVTELYKELKGDANNVQPK